MRAPLPVSDCDIAITRCRDRHFGPCSLKGEIEERWGALDLFGVLSEVDHLTGFTEESPRLPPARSPTGHLSLHPLMVLFALATNVGIRHLGGADWGETEAVLRRVRRLCVNRDNLRRRLTNATLAARDKGLMGSRHRVCVGLQNVRPSTALP